MNKKILYFSILTFTVLGLQAMEPRQTASSPLSPLAKQLVDNITSLRARNNYQKNPTDSLAKRMEAALREFMLQGVNPLESVRPEVIAETIIHFYSDDIPLLHMFIRFYITEKSIPALNKFFQGTIHVDDPLQIDGARRTLLHYAAQDGQLEVVEWLLARGAQPDIMDSPTPETPYSQSPAALACKAKASTPMQQERYQRIIILLDQARDRARQAGITASCRAPAQSVVHLSS